MRRRMQDEGAATHPHPDDLTLHALGLLAAPACRGMARHLRACGPCRRTVQSLERAASALALAAPPVRPPPGLRARVLAGLRATAGWEPIAPGIVRWRLGAADGATTHLVRVAPGTRFPGGVHPHTEHCYVVAGSVRIGDRRLEVGDRVRVPAGTVGSGRAVSDDGCLLLVTELT